MSNGAARAGLNGIIRKCRDAERMFPISKFILQNGTWTHGHNLQGFHWFTTKKLTPVYPLDWWLILRRRRICSATDTIVFSCCMSIIFHLLVSLLVSSVHVISTMGKLIIVSFNNADKGPVR